MKRWRRVPVTPERGIRTTQGYATAIGEIDGRNRGGAIRSDVIAPAPLTACRSGPPARQRTKGTPVSNQPVRLASHRSVCGLHRAACGAASVCLRRCIGLLEALHRSARGAASVGSRRRVGLLATLHAARSRHCTRLDRCTASALIATLHLPRAGMLRAVHLACLMRCTGGDVALLP